MTIPHFSSTLTVLLAAFFSVSVGHAADAAKPATEPAKANAEMQKVLDELKALGGKPMETLTAPEARKQPTPADAVKQVLIKEKKKTDPEKVAKVEDRPLKTDKGSIPARIYWPVGNGPFPVTVYYHGGGWVIANKEIYDSGPRALVNQANTIVVSIDYRQAPEHKFPAAHDDALAAYKWVLKNAASIKGDPKNVAVAGESAGGNLAVAVSMMARDQKLQMPVHELVVYPIASATMDTPSYTENATAKPLGKPLMAWFFKQYLRTPEDGKDPRIDLVNADLKGLPSTTLITAQIDPLRSEGQMLAEKLKAAGNAVESKTYDGVTHEFFGMGAVVSEAKDATKFAGSALKTAFKAK